MKKGKITTTNGEDYYKGNIATTKEKDYYNGVDGQAEMKMRKVKTKCEVLRQTEGI